MTIRKAETKNGTRPIMRIEPDKTVALPYIYIVIHCIHP